MQSHIGELVEPFERMTPPQASALLLEHFEVSAVELTRLDTERDDSFRVTSPGGDYVLKVAHPDDDPLLVNLQTAAMSFAAELEPTLPVQGLLLSREGEVEPTIVHNGRERVARLLTWIEGTPLHEVRPDADQIESLGDTLGRLTSSLSTFDHPAAHREFAWDVAQLPLVRPLLDEFGTAETSAALDLFDERVAPMLPSLPHQVVHNDFHQGNILVDSQGAVAGVIDFGDVVHTVRVADLAVALSYLVYPGAHSPAEIERFVGGYERRVPLRDDERAVLSSLVIARFAQRIMINLRLARGNPNDRGAAELAAEKNRVALAALLNEES